MNSVYLLDSDVIIDFLRRRPKAVALVTGLKNAESVGVSSLSLIEVLSGMREHERGVTYAFLDGLKTYAVDGQTGKAAGEEARRLRERGVTVASVDAAHAALCRLNGLTLVTGNGKHYPGDDLKIVELRR